MDLHRRRGSSGLEEGTTNRRKSSGLIGERGDPGCRRRDLLSGLERMGIKILDGVGVVGLQPSWPIIGPLGT